MHYRSFETKATITDLANAVKLLAGWPRNSRRYLVPIILPTIILPRLHLKNRQNDGRQNDLTHFDVNYPGHRSTVLRMRFAWFRGLRGVQCTQTWHCE